MGHHLLVFACGGLHGAQLWIKATEEELLQAHAAVQPEPHVKDFGILLLCSAMQLGPIPVRQKSKFMKFLKLYHLKLHYGNFAL